MRYTKTPVLLTLLLTSAGCIKDFEADQLNARAAANNWIVTSYQDEMIRNGVIRQGTLFPHHFHIDSASLNELGRRDMALLADHLVDAPGRLNVRRGDEPHSLYDARLATVRTSLADAGVALERVAIADGFAGGDGIVTERIVIVMKRDAERDLRTAVSTRSAQKTNTSSAAPSATAPM